MEEQPEVIELDRGDKGLGFNIKGGTDQQHIPSDDGIFVTKVREDGAAGIDGRLTKGDRIIEINGTDVRSVQHKQAVDMFLSAGGIVKLVVEHGAEKESLEAAEEKPKEPEKPHSPDEEDHTFTKYLVIGVVVVSVAVTIFMIRRRLKVI